MDPSEALRQIRRLTSEIENAVLLGQPHDVQVRALLDNVEALDEWLSRGGFLPKQWAR